MFVTEDMTLVTVLKMNGVEPTRKERANGGVQWVFDSEAAQETIANVLDEYNADECCVEPRDFTRKMAMVRRDMYGFLGHTHRRVR